MQQATEVIDFCAKGNVGTDRESAASERVRDSTRYARSTWTVRSKFFNPITFLIYYRGGTNNTIPAGVGRRAALCWGLPYFFFSQRPILNFTILLLTDVTAVSGCSRLCYRPSSWYRPGGCETLAAIGPFGHF